MKTYNSIVCPGVYVIDADGFRANVGI